MHFCLVPNCKLIFKTKLTKNHPVNFESLKVITVSYVNRLNMYAFKKQSICQYVFLVLRNIRWYQFEILSFWIALPLQVQSIRNFPFVSIFARLKSEFGTTKGTVPECVGTKRIRRSLSCIVVSNRVFQSRPNLYKNLVALFLVLYSNSNVVMLFFIAVKIENKNSN